MFLSDFQREVVMMRKVLQLYEAINQHDFRTLIEVITWFSFDDYVPYDDESFIPEYECMRFNDSYREFIATDYDHDYPEDASRSDKIRYFLEALENDVLSYEMSEPSEGMPPYILTYHDMRHSTWQALHTMFSRLMDLVDIEELNELGNLRFSRPLSDADVSEICSNDEYFLRLGKAFLSDYFNTQLGGIQPKMTFENGQFLPNLQINSLLQAMYLELFFKITPYTSLRKCANPTCNAFFEVSRDNSKKIYCSTHCAQLMAKRMQREREKLQK